ncbi:MAG: lipoprotein [Deltaproteobacteria bacterium]|nr:lipoprotein [Deltaproteobacteria bacterium]
MKRILIAAVALVLLAGCVSNTNLAGKASGTAFVYKPNAPAGGGQKLP